MMLSRFLSRGVMLMSVALIATVTFYGMDTFRRYRDRERFYRTMETLVAKEGHCAAFFALQKVPPRLKGELADVWHAMYQRLIHGIMGDSSADTVAAFREALRLDIVDEGFCSDAQQLAKHGDEHDLLRIIRIIEEGSLCSVSHWSTLLESVTPHEAKVLYKLLQDVSRLSCLSPVVQERLASLILDSLEGDPKALDDGNVPRLASYLTTVAPPFAARFACLVKARQDASLLAATMDCASFVKKDVLVRYQTLTPATLASDRGVTLPVGTEVFLLREYDDTCDVAPTTSLSGLYGLPCLFLKLASDLRVAVRVESLPYGRTQADVVAGLFDYDGDQGLIVVDTKKESHSNTWFGYNRLGDYVGAAQVTDRRAAVATTLKKSPVKPLRACRFKDTQFCADWQSTVEKLGGEPVLYLSSPASIFNQVMEVPSERNTASLCDGCQSDIAPDKDVSLFALSHGGRLLLTKSAAGLTIHWRIEQDSPWHVQEFLADAKKPKEKIEWFAVLDIERDGLPELVVSRYQASEAVVAKDNRQEEIILLTLPSKESNTFRVKKNLKLSAF